jgi:hypothetical protein
MITDDVFMGFLKQVTRFTVAAMRQDLSKHGLGNSRLAGRIKGNPTKRRLTIEVPNYGLYIDAGVQGATESLNASRFKFKTKLPPLAAILDWIRRYRNKIGRGRNKAGRFISDVSLAWAIRKAIYRRGLKSRPFIDNNLEAGYTILTQLINDPKTTDRIFAQVKFDKRKVKIG